MKSGGGWSRDELDLTGAQPLPSLDQGDILEITPLPTAAGQSDNFDSLHRKLTWHLRKRIAFPVTVEIAGKTHEIRLRGDRLVFDPALAEAPLVGAGKLMELLWQPERFPGDCKPNVLVLRKDWPEPKRPLGELLAKDFDLQSGDRVTLDLPEEIRKTDWNITLHCRSARCPTLTPDSRVASAALSCLFRAVNGVSEHLFWDVKRHGVDPERHRHGLPSACWRRCDC